MDAVLSSSDKFANLFVGLVVVVIFLVYYYYYYSLVTQPVLRTTSTKFKTFLKESMPILSEKYWPTIWCYGAHLQTTFGAVFCQDFHVPYEREILALDDGGEIALDWLHTEDKDAPIILILPGLTGCSATPYVKRFAFNAQKNNFRSVVFNYRGMGELDLKTPKIYSITNTEDVAQVVHHIKKRYPNVTLGATGTSMGSLILGNYLIRHSCEQQISVAMLNCTPYDVLTASGITKSGFSIIYNKVLANDMLKIIGRFKHVLDLEDKPWVISEVLKSKTIQEIDNNLTAKMFGYGSVHEYYKEATISDKMSEIKIPVLCLNSADDPCQPLRYSEDDDSPLFDNEKVAVLLTARGGHASHLEGLWPFQKKETYIHRVFVQYFSAMFQNDSYKQFLSTES